MNRELREHAEEIVSACIREVRPDAAVRRALDEFGFAQAPDLKDSNDPCDSTDLCDSVDSEIKMQASNVDVDPEPNADSLRGGAACGSGRLILVAAGKAAWQMASAAVSYLGEIDDGIVITKYGHVMGEIPGVTCCEAGHPVPDLNSFYATARALELVSGLEPDDKVLFLLSGGGSALFELPMIPGEELQDITRQLLACGADIVEINTIRKRLSRVKGGRFAQACAPAQVYSVVLSDILGDPLDMIASGPAYPDSSTCEDALSAVDRYGLSISDRCRELLSWETPKDLDNIHTIITGSVRQLCGTAVTKCRELGYTPVLLTDCLCCEAAEAGRFIGSIVKTHAGRGNRIAFIAGGETVVHLGNSNNSVSGQTAMPLMETGEKIDIVARSASSDNSFTGKQNEPDCNYGEGLQNVSAKGLEDDPDPGSDDGKDTGRCALGGRNQEIALAAATDISGLDAAVISFGSDGTDGPTDAAGGYADGESMAEFEAAGVDAKEALADHDSYHALKAAGGLIMTGPTGTNVNDLTVALIQS